MKVRELIALLLTFPPEVDVAYMCCSEQCVLNANDIDLIKAVPPRADGWVQNARPDMLTQDYVLFPGN